jgi:hypothetical protein
MVSESTPLRPRRRILEDEIPGLTNHAPMQELSPQHGARNGPNRQASLSPASATRHQHQRSSVVPDTRSRNMRPQLYGAIAIAAMIATPAMAQMTTTPSSNAMTPTNSDASKASNSPGAGASPHTGFSSGMTPSAGTASGTADGTTDTGATSPGSGKSATQR